MTGTPRAMRKDAVRNRERILAAARDVVAEQGAGARMEEIAARAGVGVGSVYRFMPTKQALLDAVLQEGSDRLETITAAALERPAGERLATWFEQAASWQSGDRAFLQVLAARDDGAPTPRILAPRTRKLIRALITQAQADGELRDDVTAADVLMVLLAIGRVGEGTAAVAPRYVERFTALQLAALAPAAGVIPGKGLTERQLERALDALAHTRRSPPR